MISPNLKAFLDMIAHSEIGEALLRKSDHGYNVIVGSTPAKPLLFFDYSDHPRKLVHLRPGLASTAAGRYQLLARYYDAYAQSLKLKDFSPASQDAIVIQQIKERRALMNIESGYLSLAIKQVSNIWASLPDAGYGQHENSYLALENAYLSAGGSLA